MKKIILVCLIMVFMLSTPCFAQSGAWGYRQSKTITGGTIDGTPIGSTTPSTGAFTTLTSTDTINNLYAALTVYVETTGDDNTGRVGRVDKPFKTINAALDSLPSSGGIVKIGLGTFAPIADDSDTTSSKLKDNISLVGSGQPVFNSTLTGLEYGTIIQGPLLFYRNNIKISDLGIDSGLSVTDSLYSGADKDGLAFTSPAEVLGQPSKTGVVVRNVTTIARSDTAAAHAFLFANLDSPNISNIQAAYGTHGIVFFVQGGIVNNIRTKGNDEEGVLFITRPAHLCGDLTVSNVYIASVDSLDTGGMAFWSVDGVDLSHITINGYVANATTFAYGIWGGDATSSINNIEINGMVSTANTEKSTSGLFDGNTILVNGRSIYGNINFADVDSTVIGTGVQVFQGAVASDLGILAQQSFFLGTNGVNTFPALVSGVGDKLGIGISVPTQTLDVYGSIKSYNGASGGITLNRLNNSSPNSAEIDFLTAGSYRWIAGLRGDLGPGTEDFGFYNAALGYAPTLLLQYSTGNVGIGHTTTIPNKLSVLTDFGVYANANPSVGDSSVVISTNASGDGIVTINTAGGVASIITTGADFAGLYIASPGATTIDLANGFKQITTFDTDMPEVISNGAHGTDNITVGATGVYDVSFIADGEAAANNKVYEFYVFELATSGSSVEFATQANPCIISSVAHGFSDGDRVKITGVGGMVELNGNIYTVAASTDSTYALDVDDGTDVNATGYTTWSSAGTATLATILPQIHAHRKFAVGGDIGSFSGGGLASLTISKTLELWVKGTTDSTNLTVDDCSFYMKRVQ